MASRRLSARPTTGRYNVTMRRAVSRWPIGVGLALIGLASGLPALFEVLASEYPDIVRDAPWIKKAFSVAALSCAGLGLLSLAIYPFLVLNLPDHIRLLRLRLGAALLGAFDATIAFQVVCARREDLKDLRDFCLTILGPGLSPLKKMRKWHEHNPTLFWILVAARAGSRMNADHVEAIYGYYGIIPINATASKALDEEQLDGMSFTTAHICTEGEQPSAYYIAGIAAEHKIARLKILRELKKHIESLVSSEPRIFYTRPISKDGLRLVRSFSFQRVDNSPEVALNEIHRQSLSKEALHGFTV
jgi:hypothetical protein